MKFSTAAMLVLLLALFACTRQEPRPVGFFVVNGLSIGSPAVEVRKVAARLPANNFKSDDVPATGKGMISSIGEGNTYFVFWNSKLSEYFMVEFGEPDRKYQGALSRYTKLYGNPNSNPEELPAGSSNNHAKKPDMLAFWVAPDNNSILILELSKKDDGVVTTLNSLREDPLNKNL